MASPQRPRRRPFRFLLKVVVILVTVGIALALAVPYLLSMDWARTRVERGLGEALGTGVAIGGYSFDWFRGLAVEELAIEQPAGFEHAEKLLALRSLRGDVSFLQLLRGRIDIEGVVDGFHVTLIERPDGTTNLAELLGGAVIVHGDEPAHRSPRRDRGDGEAGEELDFGMLGDVRLDLEIRDSDVHVVHTERGTLERIENIHLRCSKEFGTTAIRTELGADLRHPGDPAPGRVELLVEVDPASEQPVDARVHCTRLELGRYGALLATILQPGQLTALQGEVGGDVAVTFDREHRLRVTGTVSVERPRVAGALLQGMDVRAERWTMRPDLVVELREDRTPLAADLGEFALDLGFCQVNGLTPQAASALAGETGAGVSFAVDLAAVAEFGGPVPTELRGSGTKLTGSAALPLASLATADTDAILATLAVRSDVAVDRLEYAPLTVEGLGVAVALEGAKLTARSNDAARLNSGALRLGLDVDLAALDHTPAVVDLAIESARADGDAVAALRYAVPLLAGLDAREAAEFAAGVTAAISLRGPALRTEGQGWVEWLADWSGQLRVGMAGASFRAAEEFAPLLAFAGGETALRFDDVAADLVLADGALATESLRLQRKAQAWGMRGRTGLDGSLDWSVDLTTLLAEHRDGKKVLEYVGGDVLQGRIRGTVDAPAVAAPDLQELFTKAAQNALQRTLEKEAGKGVEDLLRGVLGGKKK